MKFLVINGPNLNMLGIREPDKYGTETYDDLLEKIEKHCEKRGVGCEFYQSNHEGALVDRIQQAYFDKTDAIVINPAAYTHTSVALLDAVKAVQIPTAEVHISDVTKREDFRQVSYIRQAVCFTVMGHGTDGYLEAIDFLMEKFEKNFMERKAVASQAESQLEEESVARQESSPLEKKLGAGQAEGFSEGKSGGNPCV